MLKIGIIGNGLEATNLVSELQTCPNIEVVGIHNCKSKVKVTKLENLEVLIGISDAVYIYPQELNNIEIIEQALKSQVHCFVASPFTDNVEIAQNVMNLAREAGVQVNVGNPDKLNPALTAALPHIKFPLFIESSKLETYTPQNAQFSVELSMLLNELAIILSIVKSEVKKISANGVSVVSDTADLASVRLEFNNGCVANLTANRVSLMPSHNARFFQKETYINIDFTNRKSTMFALKDAKRGSNTENLIDLGKKGKKEIVITSPEQNSPVSEMQNFADAILNDEEVNNPISLCLSAIEIVKKIEDKIAATSLIID